MSYWTGVATLTGIYMIAMLGMSILTGFTGLFSMGHAGFMAIGAYILAFPLWSVLSQECWRHWLLAC